MELPQGSGAFFILSQLALLLVVVSHLLRGRLTLAPLYALGGITALLLWEVRQLGWWLEFFGLHVDAALVGLAPALLLAQLLIYAFDGLLAARAFWLTILTAVLLAWGYAEFRQALAQDLPLGPLLYLSSWSHAAAMIGVLSSMAMVVVGYAVLLPLSRFLALAVAPPLGMMVLLLVSSLAEYGPQLAPAKIANEWLAYLPGSVPALLASLLYGVWVGSRQGFMPSRPVAELFQFWQGAEGNLSAARKDVLDARRVISELRQLNNALAEAKRINDYQVANSPLAILHIDPDGNVVFRNPATPRLLGEDPLGHPLRRYLLLDDGWRLPAGERRRLRLAHSEGERWIEVRSMPLFDAHGKAEGSMLLLEDVTAQVFKGRRRHIAQRLRGIHESGRVIAHDFSNLMLALDGILLQMGKAFEQRNVERFRLASDAAAQAITRCREMLQTLGSSELVSQPRLQRVDLVSLLREVAGLQRSAAESTGVELRLDLPRPLWLLGDEGQLMRVFTNLVNNALRATPAGDQILIRGDPEGNEICVRIVDGGTGMSPEEIARAFDPGFSTRGGGQGGLGLAIVYLIVDAHGGQMQLRPNPERGLTAEVRLPQAPATGEMMSAGRLLLALPDEASCERIAQASLDTFKDVLDVRTGEELDALLDEEEGWGLVVTALPVSERLLRKADTLLELRGAEIALLKGDPAWIDWLRSRLEREESAGE